MLSRRTMLRNTASFGAVAAAGAFIGLDACAKVPPATTVPETFEVTHTDAEWQKILGPQAYYVMRHEDTEPPGSSPLLNEHRKGTWSCAGCDLPLFDAATKFESGTGWPSFYQPLPNAVAIKRDTSAGMIRDECHCRRCGGHLGHVFNDGPRPTGLRYCMNGLSLKFKPA